MKHLLKLIICLLSLPLFAQQTEKLYLSGTGLGSEKEWRFYCTGGINSGKWKTIKVPSQWELQGFGEYTYGRWYKKEGVKNPSMEQGKYEYSFNVPLDWKGKALSIVFEGVMTDAEVKINGKSAGDIHQGAFYQFSYPISDKIKFGAKNKLEVTVSKHSANKSVNAAERRADWWLFGGIYRPVYLEAKPAIHIKTISVDAQFNGKLTNKIVTTPLPKGYTLNTCIVPVKGNNTYQPQSTGLQAGVAEQTIHTRWNNISSWTPETPVLYELKLELRNDKKQLVHVYTERIGFRTVEFRPQDGIYVNNVKVVLKGINRHSFHPDGGRTTNRAISLQDAQLIKQMNMNAVRSHYPPDKHFLEICDSLGLFYVDELAGWQNSYDTATGEKLLGEMLSRDVNHPCIILWSNGNEGGWNSNLDKVFYDLDPQKRRVIHPWADFDGIDTHHYPAYQTGVARFNNGFRVFMPTEFMHGMYDQGHGAGLEDFWKKYTESPLFAGGFMWAFSDEAVKRTDKNGQLDSDGYNAPDGILGPYREKEGSFYTVREIWSPIQIENKLITSSFDGTFLVSNQYLYTNLDACSLKYRLFRVGSPLTETNKHLMGEGNITLPALEPGCTGKARMTLPTDFFEADVLELEAYDQNGSSIYNRTWPIHRAAEYFSKEYKAIKENAGQATIKQPTDSMLALSAGGVNVTFSTKTGTIVQVSSPKGNISFINGPIAVGMKAKLKNFASRTEKDKAVLTFFYQGGIDSVRWEMHASGMLKMSALMLNRSSGGGGLDDAFMDDKIYNLGLTFSYPEKATTGVRWFGRGPYRVWKNRIKGTQYGLWQKAYNNTITGENFEQLIYPEFKGYHAHLFWAKIENKESDFTVFSENDGVFLRLFTPEEPHYRQEKANTMPDFPSGDISFLYEIPAIRDFKPVEQHGPNSQPSSVRIKKGDEGISMKLWFDFRSKP